jgi:hypothetical protein
MSTKTTECKRAGSTALSGAKSATSGEAETMAAMEDVLFADARCRGSPHGSYQPRTQTEALSRHHRPNVKNNTGDGFPAREAGHIQTLR